MHYIHSVQGNMKSNTQLRKRLLEEKERKENLMIEQSLFTKRVIMIFENETNIKNFKNLSEEKKLKYSFKLMKEMSDQNSFGVINENLTDWIQKIFGTSVGSGAAQTILEPALNFILSGIGIGDSPLKMFIISFLSKKEGFWNVFKDCDTATKMISESIVEAFVMEASQSAGVGGFWESALRNTLGDVATKTAMVSSLEQKLSSKVCEFFGKASKNAKSVYDKLTTDATNLVTTGS